MSDITLSSAVRSNLLNLQSTADLLGKTQERLATGKEVNSALDNPTNFFTASSLNSRASDLNRLLDSVSNATQTLEAADNGISAITKLVESAQASARQALQASGQVTESKVVGSTSATFNPSALTNVAGDNDATGTNTGAVAADAAASLDFLDIAEDLNNIADVATGALGVAGDSSDTLDGLTSALVDTDSITLNVNGVDYTLNITDDGADQTGNRAGDDTNGYTFALDQDTTLANTVTALNKLFDGSGVSVADDTDSTLTYSFDTTVDVVKASASGANSGDLAALGLNAIGESDETTGGDTGDRILARNTDVQAFLADNADGETLAFQLGAGATTTITLGSDAAAGQLSSKDDIVAALNAASDLSATNAGGGGAITLTASDSNDFSNSLTVTASNAATNTFFNADVATDDAGIDLDTQNALVTTSQANNLLTQGAVEQGNTLNIKVGNSTQLDVTFGTGAGQVESLTDLNATLQNLAGGAASVDTRGELNITSDNAGEVVTIGGTTDALSSFGVTAGEASSLLDGTNIADGDVLSIKVGNNNQLDITFGTDTGEVNTLDELQDALGNLAGGKAEIDTTTGAISIEATAGTDSIVVSSTDSVPASKDAVAASFGLQQATTNSVTTDSTTRSELRDQFNELLVQIDELAEDSGFNGINLLNGDDLKVIFNEDGSSNLDIEGVNFDSGSLGLSRQVSQAFQSDSTIEGVLNQLDTTINTLRSQASKFGSNLSVVETREDFTKNTINTLETGAANLTLADTNEEGANLLALQTRQSLSTTALSLSSQADQNVLRLF